MSIALRLLLWISGGIELALGIWFAVAGAEHPLLRTLAGTEGAAPPAWRAVAYFLALACLFAAGLHGLILNWLRREREEAFALMNLYGVFALLSGIALYFALRGGTHPAASLALAAWIPLAVDSLRGGLILLVGNLEHHRPNTVRTLRLPTGEGRGSRSGRRPGEDRRRRSSSRGERGRRPGQAPRRSERKERDDQRSRRGRRRGGTRSPAAADRQREERVERPERDRPDREGESGSGRSRRRRSRRSRRSSSDGRRASASVSESTPAAAAPLAPEEKASSEQRPRREGRSDRHQEPRRAPEPRHSGEAATSRRDSRPERAAAPAAEADHDARAHDRHESEGRSSRRGRTRRGRGERQARGSGRSGDNGRSQNDGRAVAGEKTGEKGTSAPDLPPDATIGPVREGPPSEGSAVEVITPASYEAGRRRKRGRYSITGALFRPRQKRVHRPLGGGTVSRDWSWPEPKAEPEPPEPERKSQEDGDSKA